MNNDAPRNDLPVEEECGLVLRGKHGIVESQ